MTRAGRPTKRSSRGAAHHEPTALASSLVNIALAAAGVLALLAGFWMLDRGSIVAAPITLVFGYLVLLPAAILYDPHGG